MSENKTEIQLNFFHYKQKKTFLSLKNQDLVKKGRKDYINHLFVLKNLLGYKTDNHKYLKIISLQSLLILITFREIIISTCMVVRMVFD